MSVSSIVYPPRTTDAEALAREGNTGRLVDLLGHPDDDVQRRAIEALKGLGDRSIEPLERVAVKGHTINQRLGAIEAIAAIKEPGTLLTLRQILRSDRSVECRWAAALAMGAIGDSASIAPLVKSLQDSSKYVRYGAVTALEQLGWEPENDRELVLSMIARQDWDAVAKVANPPLEPLIQATKDPDPGIRVAALRTLGELERVDAGAACVTTLQDSDSKVRWQASVSLPRCGVARLHLPITLSRWPRSKDPGVAAFLNFLFLGLGYNYLGRWWGLLAFQLFTTFNLFVVLMLGSPLPFMRIPFTDIPSLVTLPYSIPFGIHAWYVAKKMVV